MTDHALAKLYRDACHADDRAFDGVDIGELIDLAEGRLAGERRFAVVAAIAQSPRLASAYRMAKAGGEWSRAVAADLAQETRAAPVAPATVLPLRRSRPVHRRFALAAAVSVMAIGAVFVGHRAQQGPMPLDASELAALESLSVESDAILATSFGRNGDGDVIFSARSDADDDRIFAFGRGS